MPNVATWNKELQRPVQNTCQGERAHRVFGKKFANSLDLSIAHGKRQRQRQRQRRAAAASEAAIR